MKFIIFFLITVFAFAKNILIINSYSVQFPWTKGEVEGILKNLKNKNLKIYIEFMDTKLFEPTHEYLNNFYKYILKKYKKIKFDIVITTDDNALNFVLSHKKDFFKTSKIFFAGVNNLSIVNKIDRNCVTGVFEKKEPLFNLNFLKKAVKNLKKVYVVADNSNSANAVINEYKNAFKNINNIKFVYINSKNLNEVLLKIKDYKNSGMLLLTPFSFTYNNKHIDYKKAIKILSDFYKKPIVIHTDILASLPNTNIIGGRVTDSLSQGESVSRKVLEYLKGEKINKIPLTYEKANRIYINVKNMEKFHIDIADLKYKNAIYVNKPVNFFEIYKKYIIAVGIIVFVLIVFVIVLLIKNHKLKKYNSEIIKSNENFEKEIQEKFNELSKIYSEKTQIKTEAISNILKFMLKNLRIIIHQLKNDEKCLKKAEAVETILNFFENSFEKKEKFSVKKRIGEIIEVLNQTKFLKNIKLHGNDFEINLDKILFTGIMLKLLKDNCKVTVLDNKIIINYESEIPLDIEEIKIKNGKIFNIMTNFDKNEIVLHF